MTREAVMQRRARPRSGFTLIEMMVALAILAGGLLAMLSVQVQALKQGRYGRHTSEAMQIARDQMELFMRLPWGAVPPVAWTATAPIDVTVQNEGGAVVQQTFNVSWRITASVPTAGPAAGFEPNARTIDIDVTWTEADANAGFARRYVLSSIKNNET